MSFTSAQIMKRNGKCVAGGLVGTLALFGFGFALTSLSSNHLRKRAVVVELAIEPANTKFETFEANGVFVVDYNYPDASSWDPVRLAFPPTLACWPLSSSSSSSSSCPPGTLPPRLRAYELPVCCVSPLRCGDDRLRPHLSLTRVARLFPAPPHLARVPPVLELGKRGGSVRNYLQALRLRRRRTVLL